MSTATQRYECTVCEHVIDSEDKMLSDCCSDEECGEKWSKWICPHCGYWHDSLRGWIKLDPE